MFEERDAGNKGSIGNQGSVAAQGGAAGAGKTGTAMIRSGIIVSGATGSLLPAAGLEHGLSGFPVRWLEGIARVQGKATTIAGNGDQSHEEHDGYHFFEHAGSHTHWPRFHELSHHSRALLSMSIDNFQTSNRNFTATSQRSAKSNNF
jgi:hypothetical protein